VLPASSAARARAKCVPVGVATTTASTAGSASARFEVTIQADTRKRVWTSASRAGSVSTTQRTSARGGFWKFG
jgi:hypothetical protein